MNYIEKAAEARKKVQRRDIEQSMHMREDKEGEEFPEGGSTTETSKGSFTTETDGSECIVLGTFVWVLGVVMYNGDEICQLGSKLLFLLGFVAFGWHPRAPRVINWLGRLAMIAMIAIGVMLSVSLAVVVVKIIAPVLFSGLSAMWGDFVRMIGT